jgi:hypothetical protein
MFVTNFFVAGTLLVAIVRWIRRIHGLKNYSHIVMMIMMKLMKLMMRPFLTDTATKPII